MLPWISQPFAHVIWEISSNLLNSKTEVVERSFKVFFYVFFFFLSTGYRFYLCVPRDNFRIPVKRTWVDLKNFVPDQFFWITRSARHWSRITQHITRKHFNVKHIISCMAHFMASRNKTKMNLTRNHKHLLKMWALFIFG